jgi:hypothetical protein
MSPYNDNSWPGGTLASGPTIDDGFQRSLWPMIFSEIAYKTDACGKIGPWMLQFALGGIYGQEKPIEPATLGPVGDINGAGSFVAGGAANTNGNGSQYWNPGGYADDNVDMWMITARTYIPIIPEKAPGQLRNSLGLALTGFTGQDIRRFAGPTPFAQAAYAYNRANYTPGLNTLARPVADFTAPVATGGWGQLAYYWTDTLWSGFYYGQVKYNISHARGGITNPATGALAQPAASVIGAGAVDREQQYAVNLVYDPNPAIRLGLEYTYTTSHYPRNLYTQSTGALTSSGSNNSIRFAAQYFF